MSPHFEPVKETHNSIRQRCVRCDKQFTSASAGTVCRGCVAELLAIDAIDKEVAAKQEEEYGNKKSDRSS